MTLRRIIGMMVWVLILVAASATVFAQDETVPADGGTTRVYIDINQPFAKKIPIAIPDFMPIQAGGSGSGEVRIQLPKRLSDNLDMTGLFIALDKRVFLEANPRAGLANEAGIKYDEWLAIGSELLVKGGFSMAGDQLVLEMRLFDMFQQKMVLGRRYSGHPKDGRRMINRFTNEIMRLITGEPGIFGTKMVFVSGARANKSIMMTEVGTDEVKGVAGGPGGPYTQPTMSNGGDIAYTHREGTIWQLVAGGQVISQGPLHVSPAFTPGGGLLAAMSGKHDTNIFMFRGPGARPIPITKHWGINISPSVSPDGGQMVFVSDRGGGPQLYISSVGGGSARRLTVEGKENTDPNWSPRGDRIVFCGDSKEIFSINPDGSDLQQLTYGQGRNTRPTWSPDGRMIAFSSTRNGRNQIFVMTANGERQQPLMPNYKGDQKQPYWCQADVDFWEKKALAAESGGGG
jgi:TolB protein